MSLKNARTLGIRLDQIDNERLEKFERETTMDGVSLARASLKAALNYYEETGSISFPLHIADKYSKSQAPTVKTGPTTPTTQTKHSQIIPLNQNQAADQPADNRDLSPKVRVRYPSGKNQAKKEA
jgi:hypothetical protein